MLDPSLTPGRKRARRIRHCALIAAATVNLLAFGTDAEAQTGANVLLVINTMSTASETVGRQYAAQRGVPQDNICAIGVPVGEAVSRATYRAQIDQPIWRCIATMQ